MFNALLPNRRRTSEKAPKAKKPAIRKAADIIDADQLAADLLAAAERAAEEGSDPTRALLAVVRPALAAGEEAVEKRLSADAGAAETSMAERAFLADTIIGALADVAVGTVFPTHNPTTSEKLAIIAVGGYGRAELAPFSDIDLLFLLPYKRSPVIEQIVECLLYVLWDTGWKVGYATRSLTETLRAAEADITIRTGLLDARPVWGEDALWDQLRKGFDRQFGTAGGHAFAVAKLAERDERHKRMGDSRYALEPNIKEGKGGLRDLHTLFWIAKYFYRGEAPGCLVEAGVLTNAEARTFRKAHHFLSTIRCHLHHTTGRADEVLTFDVQTTIAERLGYADRAGVSGVERFMKHYFLVAKQVGDLTRIVCAGLELDSRPKSARRFLPFAGSLPELEGFVIRAGRLDVPEDDHFNQQPLDIIRVFSVAHTHDLDIHPRALKQIHRAQRGLIPTLRSDPEANALFLSILAGSKNPEPMLRRMSESGVLARFVPDFGRVIAQMQYDMYHVYTVDEHTILALSILHKLGAGDFASEMPLATRVLSELDSRRALAVALFFHDIAKGRGGDHSILGARVAKRLCPRLGLTEAECEMVEWLVLHHLAMSNIAFRRDIEDDKTLEDFAALVESPERLRLLLVLTTIDINAVGPGRWTAWKAMLIGQLFSRTMELLSGGLDSTVRSARVEQAQAEFIDAAKAADPPLPAPTVEEFLAVTHPGYWLAFDAGTHLYHATMAHEVREQPRPLCIRTRKNGSRGMTEVTVYAGDHAGLSSLIAGGINVAGGRILDARLFTLSNGMALDVFSIQDMPSDETAGQSSRLDRVAETIEKTLRGDIQLLNMLAAQRSPLPERSKVFAAAPRVVIDNNASNQCTVIEVNGRDRPGILFGLSKAVTDAGLRIATAKITTYGERVVDVFYVKDIFGLKMTNEAKLEEIREALMTVMDTSPTVKEAGGGDGQASRRQIVDRNARERAKRNKHTVSRSMGGGRNGKPAPDGKLEAEQT